MRVEPDGALRVEERLTFAFQGSFRGAFREVPLRPGERLDQALVAEAGGRYTPGAPAEVGSSGQPGTFGMARTDRGVRIVWHFRAADETRTFTVGYRLAGLTVAYDDVVDVNLQVWGGEWEVGLGRLTATLELPGPASGPAYRAWGHPVWVRGDVTLEPTRVSLRALDVPPRQFVELRVVFPRSLLASTEGARVAAGATLDRIVAEERQDAAVFERDRERLRAAAANLPRTLAVLLLLAFGPGALAAGAVYFLHGRERGTGYDREYEQAPPSGHPPALVPPLLRQSPWVGAHEFTATLFDLIRRGRYAARPVTTEVSTWGGLRRERVSDLELRHGHRALALAPFEEPVAEVVEDLLGDGPRRLTEFRTLIASDRRRNSERFTRFRSLVASAIRQERWFVSTGLLWLGAAIAGFLATGVALLALGISGFRPMAPRWKDVVLLALGACAVVDAAVLGVAAANVRLWRRRSRRAQALAERWEAFRRYLTDFPRMEEAPPASLELWEAYLVYAIAFGVADRVLRAAQLHLPPELHEASSIYWISGTGDLGSGPSALAIGDLSAGFGSALAPPSSGSAGFGGGFSGGGRGGGGGGGGGAW